MAVVGSFIKQPTEVYDIDIDYTNKLPGSALLSSGTVGAVDMADDSDVSATVLTSQTAVITGSNLKAQVGVQAGTAGKNYKITFTVTLDSGRILQDEVIMQVREL